MRKESGIKFPIISSLQSFADLQRAQNLQRFFKTGRGGYGEGDMFLGVKVPDIRKIANKYWRETDIQAAAALLKNQYHEVRCCTLFILVKRYQKLAAERGKIYRLYIASTKYINNWDLVDLTASHIVGAYLEDKPKDLLYMFAHSKDLWQRRIAMLATFYYIYKGRAEETLKIARMLLNDKHDLIHKAVGWMLREVGKRCGEKILMDFLDQYSRIMPRTMLRYAIEKLSPFQRRSYLNNKAVVK